MNTDEPVSPANDVVIYEVENAPSPALRRGSVDALKKAGPRRGAGNPRA